MKLSIVTPIYNEGHLAVKGFETIPRMADLELLVYDDGSTDDTWELIQKYKEDHPFMRIEIQRGIKNRGNGYAHNVLQEMASGEYINSLDADDRLNTLEYIRVIHELDGSDIIYIDAMTNDGSIMHLTHDNKENLPAPFFRFWRREFIKNIRHPDTVRAGEDWWFNKKVLSMKPVEKFTGIMAYYYNFPRKGSITDLVKQGALKYDVPENKEYWIGEEKI